MDFVVKRRTLFRNLKAIDEPPLSAEKKLGRPVKLMDEQWDIVAGAIFLGEKNGPAVGGDMDRGQF